MKIKKVKKGANRKTQILFYTCVGGSCAISPKSPKGDFNNFLLNPKYPICWPRLFKDNREQNRQTYESEASLNNQ